MARYTFFAIFKELSSEADTLRLAQDFVLEEWRACLDHKKVPPIHDAKVSFRACDIQKYPYQELLRNWAWTRFTNSFGDLCYRGTVYSDVDELLCDLSAEYKLMQLTVETDE